MIKALEMQLSNLAVIIFPVSCLPESSSAQFASLEGDNQSQDGAENDNDGQSHGLTVQTTIRALSLLSQFSSKIVC